MFRNPVIGRICTGRHGDMAEQRIGARPQSAIADEMHGEAVACGDTLHFGLHRTGIAVDINLHHEGDYAARRCFPRCRGRLRL